MNNEMSIGVFDSGVGGLTVLHALQKELPAENFIYLGDTARVPYGTRSPETIVRYSSRVAGHLMRYDIKALVIACNTATSYALETLQKACGKRNIPVFGVIEPSAQVALEKTVNGNILVLGTEGTIQGHKYTETLHRMNPQITVQGLACPLFVPLIEEGWHNHSVTATVAKEYFSQIPNLTSFDTAILGCTHYPLIKPVLENIYPSIHFIDSAETTAKIVHNKLVDINRLKSSNTAISDGQTRFLVTDNLQRFRKVGYYFVGYEPNPIDMVDLTDADEQIVTKLL